MRIAIYGPPGTGKTTELLKYIDNDPRCIVMSHTKSNAREIAKRAKSNLAKVSTIHAKSFEILAVHRIQVIGNKELLDFGNKHKIKMCGPFESFEGDCYLKIYKFSRNSDIDPGAAWRRYPHKIGSYSRFVFFCSSYENWKMDNGYFDFEDMLVGACEAPPPEADRLVIDEFQDINPLQFKLLKHWSLDIPDFIFAGDDDQSLYAWNGSRPELMQEMEEFIGAERVVLEKSWRVPVKHFDMANKCISKIKNRVPKLYKPADRDGYIRRCQNLNSIDFKKDTLVIYRNHSMRNIIEDHLIRLSIPYVVGSSGKRGMFDDSYADIVRDYLTIGTIHQLKLTRLIKHTKTAYKCYVTNRTNDLPWHVVLDIPKGNLDYLKRAGDLFEIPKVKLDTIHGAKGAECENVVFINGMTGKTYIGNYASREMRENELRAMYVALTRSKNSLHIVTHKNSTEWWM